MLVEKSDKERLKTTVAERVGVQEYSSKLGERDE
jgi:hypothetical protein